MNNQGSSPEGPGRKFTSGRGRPDFYFCLVAQINSLFFNHTFHHSICFSDCSFPYISSLNLVFVCVYFSLSLSSSSVLSPACCNWSFASAIKSFDIQFLFQGKVVFSLSKCLVESIVIGQAHHQLLLYTLLRLTIIF